LVLDVVELPDEFIVSLFVGINCHVGDDVETLVVSGTDENGPEDSGVMTRIVGNGQKMVGLVVRIIVSMNRIPEPLSCGLVDEWVTSHTSRVVAEVVSDEFARHCVIPPWQLS
jgi:hypothetical protein